MLSNDGRSRGLNCNKSLSQLRNGGKVHSNLLGKIKIKKKIRKRKIIESIIETELPAHHFIETD